MKPTRHLLLDYLASHRVATAKELSRGLQVTAADIRHHLKVLIDEGVVESIGRRQPAGRGRPARVFRLSQQTVGENLGILAGALLSEALNNNPNDDQQEYLQRVAKLLAGDGALHRNLTRRLYQATQRLNELNYQARWEAHTDAPQVIFGHCPYASILERHPELCQLDARLLEGLLGTPVSQVARLAQDERGAFTCKFRVESE